MTLLAPASRARRAALPLVLCAGLTAVLTSCGEEPVDPDAGTNGMGKLSATQIESKARAAADGAKAVRLSGKLVSKGGTYTLNMRLNETGASGSVVTKTSTFELLRVGDALYLRADADFWTSAEEEPDDSGTKAADKLDDMYVKVPQDDPSYKQLRGFTEMNVLLNGLLELHGDLVKGDRSKVGGIRTIKVAGGPKGEGGTLDVSLEGTPYPLQFARGGGAGVVVLSDWNKTFPLTPPSKDETLDYGRQLPRTSD
ncbi:hypothetical protein AMK26_09750 [Streptomyces sp. CB03234]|uniref:hypothetical protein n=1 Tax=Streptomyces sp. (strain CB03234) TaxID=1703937 RepID=UPI00093F90B1|nr:hypothetical protein [Streptomyces sp. CB03234]OKK06314.1 hypothetical protein AMK26_09750 [Streptomyces sp. CB03234]